MPDTTLRPLHVGLDVDKDPIMAVADEGAPKHGPSAPSATTPASDVAIHVTMVVLGMAASLFFLFGRVRAQGEANGSGMRIRRTETRQSQMPGVWQQGIRACTWPIRTDLALHKPATVPVSGHVQTYGQNVQLQSGRNQMWRPHGGRNQDHSRPMLTARVPKPEPSQAFEMRGSFKGEPSLYARLARKLPEGGWPDLSTATANRVLLRL